jgi:uncharacterized iron-regulated membrane protein
MALMAFYAGLIMGVLIGLVLAAGLSFVFGDNQEAKLDRSEQASENL